jgi:EAL domain-containing protein (putative c-di-GMP-specific phosphodiesterase class I)
MEHALDKHQFLLYLQPKYLLVDDSLCGAEALVRWHHPDRGLLLPDQFLPTFERTGFIRKIDLYMFEQVCATIRRWLDVGETVFPVSVNLSRSHLDDFNLVPVLTSLVKYYGIPCSLLELEITENSFRDDEQGMLRMLTELKTEGFAVAMDDFGTGYSTLNILKDIPLDTLKLDKGFLDECVESERGRSVITDVVSMARHLNMHVICEGIETESQYLFLKRIGCEMGQGFFFSKPLSVADFETTVMGTARSMDPQLKMFDYMPGPSSFFQPNV